MNQGAIEFMWDREKPVPAVPQVIVFERSLNLENMISVGEKNYLIRLKGYNEIAQWANNSAKIKK
ncbi:MAG: hypothetical protein U5J95_02525 [Balneolaceae bacterium]|nr:hypothetical protein [Balneolaceae bacterium]